MRIPKSAKLRNSDHFKGDLLKMKEPRPAEGSNNGKG